MYFSQTFMALAAISSVTFASPVSLQARQNRMSVHQVNSGRKYLKSGPREYKKALNKYGADIPTNVFSAADAEQSGSAPAENGQYDALYLTPVSVGGQTLMLDFDTGSSDLWCFSTELPQSQTKGHAIYDPSKSSTSQELQGESWEISYGDGSGASGIVFADTVKVGPVTATKQAVEAATSISEAFVSRDVNTDGLLGLAFSKINTVQPTQQTTFFDTVIDTLAAPLFAVALKYQAPGVYDFGYIDESRFTGEITYTPVNSAQGFWEFTADGFAVGSQQKSGSLDCIADTGTSLVLIDDSVVRAYYAQVQGAQNSPTQGGYIFPCDAELPTWGLTIGGVTFSVPGKYMNFAPIGDGTCFGGIQSSQGIGFNIIGDTWLKGQYVIFDSSKPQLGVASQTAGGSSGGNGTNSTNVTYHRPSLRSVKLF